MKCLACQAQGCVQIPGDRAYDPGLGRISVTLVDIMVLHCPACKREWITIPRLAALQRDLLAASVLAIDTNFDRHVYASFDTEVRSWCVSVTKKSPAATPETPK